jgi:hypothetical protein
VNDIADSTGDPESTISPPRGLSARQRVTLAALGGIYLGLTVAWLFAARANQIIVDDRFQQAMMSFGGFFAIVAAPLYFFTTMVVIRNWLGRLATLLLGLIVLFPFPLFWGVVPS